MQTLIVNTSIPCSPRQLTQRRKDISAQAVDILGKEGAHDLFHNHQEGKTVHRYPLIQYRVQSRKLCVFAIGDAASILLRVIIEADLNNPRHLLTLNSIKLQQNLAEISPSPRFEYYRLMDWVAFNSETYKQKWNASYSLLERVTLLNQAITGHLRVLGHQFLSKEEVANMHGELYMLTQRKTQSLYGNQVMGFNVIFKTPYHLPKHFSLGRGISIGAGTFRRLKSNPEGNNNQRKAALFHTNKVNSEMHFLTSTKVPEIMNV